MPNSAPAPDVIVLAGGRASRMGGVDKPGLVVGGRSMLETALAAAGSGRTVVVGPPRPELAASILQTREPQPGSGPVAAIAAGVAALGAGITAQVVVLAADMPFLTPAVINELLWQLADFDAVFAADSNGRPQYLIGVWRYEPLAARLRELGTVINQPMKALVPRHTKMVTLAGVDDCDTPGDIDAARSALGPDPAPPRYIDSGKPHRTVDDGAHRPCGSAAGRRRPERGFDSNRGADGRTAGSGTAGIGVPGVLAADDTGADDELAATTATGAPVPEVIAPSVADTRNLHGAGVRAAAADPPLPLDQARRVLGETLSRLPERCCELNAARGAALATSINAFGALPRFDVSAMDGYAVRGAGPWQLRADIGFAGGQRPDGLHPGEAVRIATGAQVPEGTTCVLRDEFARYDGRLHRLPGTPERSDIRRRGEDRTPGDTIAPAGSAVTAALVSAAAAVEVTTATVRGPVRARIVMTGDEIRSTGPLQAGQTRDSIGPVLPVLLAAHGVQTLDQVHLRDTSHGFDQVLATATDCDLLVVVGATGSGAADQLRGALDRARARILVPRLALRPGGSTVAAELPSATTVLGLPGNPFAAVVTLLALIPAVVAGRTGAHPPRPLIGPLHNATEIAGPVTRIVPARIATDPAGAWIGDPTVRTAHLGGLVDRDGVVVVPADASDGTPVEFIPVPR